MSSTVLCPQAANACSCHLSITLLIIYRIFCLYAVFKVRCDNVSCFRLSAQETSFLSLTDILRISVHRPANPSLYAQVRNAFLCCTAQAIRFIIKWRWRDSNSWPPACKAGALPTELHPHRDKYSYLKVIYSFLNLAATCSPTPSPVQYHRPLRS